MSGPLAGSTTKSQVSGQGDMCTWNSLEPQDAETQ